MKNKTAVLPEGKITGKRLLKSFGIAGFLFFLIKGLVWLFVFFGLGNLIGK